MEIEKEKRKIEFWENEDNYDNLQEFFEKHKPEKPLTKMVEIVVTFIFYADCVVSRPSKGSLTLHTLLTYMCDLLVHERFIKNEYQITSISFEKREGQTPGISFFMQEVE